MSAETLNKIYHDSKAHNSLGGFKWYLRRARQLPVPGATLQTVQEHLRSEQAYTLHKFARRWFIRHNTQVAGIDAQWQTDLADMQGISMQNIEMRYVLTVIDVFSKLAWAIPVHFTDAKAITAAFGQVLTVAHPRYPRRLPSDKGNKFVSSDIKVLMKNQISKPSGIQHFASESEQKAAVVERLNQTINTRIWTYLSDRSTVRWLDIIKNFVDAYNHSRHCSIGMAPSEVQKKNKNSLWVRLFGNGDTNFKLIIPQGAMVRASSHKPNIDKEYMPNWTEEHFTVSQAVPPKRKTKRRVYKLVNYNDEPVKGS